MYKKFPALGQKMEVATWQRMKKAYSSWEQSLMEASKKKGALVLQLEEASFSQQQKWAWIWVLDYVRSVLKLSLFRCDFRKLFESKIKAEIVLR